MAARLREQITDGKLPLGARIGSEEDLAERFGVSRGVVARALVQLREEGLIQTVHGRGSYVAVTPDITLVELHPGDRVLARMPEETERAALRLPPGVPLLVIRRPGGKEEQYSAAVTQIAGK